MKDQTRCDLSEDPDFEREAALEIGRFVIGFGKLETDLGLAIAWGNGGKELESRSEDLIGASFGTRLKMLKDHIEALPLTDSACKAAYSRWIEAAERLRDARNRLVHGRWAVLQKEGVVVNVINPPTSLNQKEFRYRLPDLVWLVKQISDAREELAGIRRKWPLV